MQKIDKRQDDGPVELGSIAKDTMGAQGVIIEGFTLQPKEGITAD